MTQLGPVYASDPKTLATYPARGHRDRTALVTCSGTTCPPCFRPTGPEATKTASEPTLGEK